MGTNQQQRKEQMELRDGQCLKPKVERIMIALAHKRPIKAISDLYGVSMQDVVQIHRSVGFGAKDKIDG